jgi:DNA-binding transcriptional MerR regulator
MSKSPDAFRTIREVADWLGVAAHVLRFWESKFSQIRPVKRAGGRRYYRPADMELVGGIKVLLHDRGMTVRGVQRMLREEGVAAVAGAVAAARRDRGAERTGRGHRRRSRVATMRREAGNPPKRPLPAACSLPRTRTGRGGGGPETAPASATGPRRRLQEPAVPSPSRSQTGAARARTGPKRSNHARGGGRGAGHWRPTRRRPAQNRSPQSRPRAPGSTGLPPSSPSPRRCPRTTAPACAPPSRRSAA